MKATALALSALAMAAMLALPSPAAAAGLQGRTLTLTRPDGTAMGSVMLAAQGVAHATTRNGKTSAGTWAMQGDRVCVTLPPRQQACWGSAKELAANGHATMTNRGGKQMVVTAQ